MFSLEAFHWRLDLRLDPDERLVEFDGAVNCSPSDMAGRTYLSRLAPLPKKMLLLELIILCSRFSGMELVPLAGPRFFSLRFSMPPFLYLFTHLLNVLTGMPYTEQISFCLFDFIDVR